MEEKERLKQAESHLEKALEKYIELQNEFENSAKRLVVAINRIEDELHEARYHLKECVNDEKQVNG